MTPYSDIADELLRHGTSTLCEASRLPCALDYAIRPVWPGAAVAGPAYPLRCAPGDNLAIHIAVDAVPPGHVLVVDASGYVAGYWGEVLTVAAEARHIKGIIIDGGLRDIDALERRKFPAFARGIGMRGTVKFHAPSVGEPIVMSGVAIAPGDLVVGDTDGVLAIPQAAVARTLEAARLRTDKEAVTMKRLLAGETTLDLLGLTAHRLPKR
ncbi:MAG: dimethylmenaquinone methyltransferase [Pseudolabrys sp.]|nr:dimethylmenaquinone methyltransferase [Pseudolabrys sp.]